MYLRRRGATLTLVAVCILIILTIGVGAFFLMKIMGGGREVANASDAGALNVAKNVLVKVGVKPPDEFKACAEVPGADITLITYNRCVAQALLVALNAEKEGTSESRQNAQGVIAKLKDLGDELRTDIQKRENIQNYFDELTAVNNTRMNGNNRISLSDYQTAFMKPGDASNVYLDSASLPITTLPSAWTSDGSIKGPNGEKFLAGYVGMPVAGQQIYAVPVFPKQTSHLVSLFDFATAKSPAQEVPPNAFKTVCRAFDSRAGNFGGAVACSIVGAIDKTFVGSIPGGYIEIANLSGKSVPASWRESVLAADSIFNHQLYYGLDVAPLGNGKFAFSRRAGEMQAWANYNSSTGSDSNGHNALLNPTLPANDFPLQFTLRAGCTQGEYAQLSDALQIKSFTPCNDFSFGQNPDPVCAAAYQCMRNVYNGLGTSAIQTSPDSFSNIEVMKAGVCNALNGVLDNPSSGCRTVDPPKTASGLRAFDHGKHYPAPPAEVRFAEDGTILQLIDQSTSAPCTANVFNEIAQRCREILPGTTDNTIRGLLNTKITMGQNGKVMVLYITRSGNVLTISPNKPQYYTDMKPDGPDPNNITCETVDYLASDLQVNTKKTPDTPCGDTGVWDAPFLQAPAVEGHDSAHWQPSSGAGNLLGRLEFSQMVTGGGEYCVPN